MMDPVVVLLDLRRKNDYRIRSALQDGGYGQAYQTERDPAYGIKSEYEKKEIPTETREDSIDCEKRI